MIQVFDKNGNKIAESNSSISVEVENSRRDCMVYIDYTKGSEDSITVSFGAKEIITGEIFPIQQDDGSNLVEYKRTLSAGKYRIYLPMAQNEEALQVNISMNGDLSSEGTVKVWVIPMYKSY